MVEPVAVVVLRVGFGVGPQAGAEVEVVAGRLVVVGRLVVAGIGIEVVIVVVTEAEAEVVIVVVVVAGQRVVEPGFASYYFAWQKPVYRILLEKDGEGRRRKLILHQKQILPKRDRP